MLAAPFLDSLQKSEVSIVNCPKQAFVFASRS